MSEKVRVDLGERSYDIIFDSVDSPSVIGALSALPQKDVLLTADSNTARFMPRVSAALRAAGKQVYQWTFPAGESSKTMDNAMALCGRASELKLGRNTLFAALGGGVTGDLTGFAASIYMRGVGFVQIPTSLLAMVDSSVGGKTAVDTPYGKNLAGAFHQPQMVIIDCDFLNTLPVREIGCGMAEIVKTAMILDKKFAEKLEGFSGNILENPELLLFAVKRSCEIKAMVVSADEKESGTSGRVFLNYGHTFGHAVEHLSAFRLAHGEAVALGMDMAAFAAENLGICGKEVIPFQHKLLENYRIAPESFPLAAVKHDPEKIVEVMKGDKKNGGGSFRAVLPLEAGKVQTFELAPDKCCELIEKYYSFRFKKVHPAGTLPEVAVVGLGLLGSSLALSIDRSCYRVGVWNRNAAASKWIMDKGAADKVYPSADEAFASADIIILALPVPVAEKFICTYHDKMRPGAVLTDIGSVKTRIMSCAEKFENLNFVGSHPMAGTEKSGYANGFKGLFSNADVFVVPGKYSTAEGVEQVENFWKHLNCHTVTADTASHDALVAHTSHMLHIIASALTRSILAREDAVEQRRHYSGCATGFRDTSRIASSSPEMWKEICMENRLAILPALEEFRKSLAEFESTLVNGDGEKFAELFLHGKNLRDSWLCYKNYRKMPGNIVLCGIKHCGKSTVGREIAAILDMPLIDSDREIEVLDGKNRTCREIFKSEGEEYFRKLEAAVLEKLASSTEKAVISLGGGAFSNPFVSSELKAGIGFKLWLEVDDMTAFERIKANGLPPFLSETADPFETFVAMNRKRRELFAACADARIDTCQTPYRTALQALSLYKEHFNL
ncbi:MAG: 3-dehydroquinate synthase [Lentisphaerae bacterium]|nr:3-dehydroquinate synthase [Lentisphaerota bacterium]